MNRRENKPALARGAVHRCVLAAMLLLLLRPAFAAATTVPQPRPGWTMQLIAEAPVIRHPSVVCAAPNGRVFVAEDPMDISARNATLQEGRILCFHPDGHVTVFADHLHAVFGMQYLEGKLYVLHNPKFSVFTDDSGVGRDRSDLIEQTHPNPWALDWNDHVPANFRLAMDGYFYVAVGDKGLYGAVDRSGRRVDLHGGGVVRIRPDGTGLEVFCTGVRNILDVAVNDEDELFTYDNTDEHEWMGRLTFMVDGGFYGYPFDFVPRRPYTLWMFADYGPGAATGVLAWNDDSLPRDWRSNLILGDFGQRNLRRVRIARDGAAYRAVADELLFVNPPADFRPVGIAETADGRGFYVCDWQHADTKDAVTVGRLWKLTAAFATNTPAKPAWYRPAALGQSANGPIDELLAGLSHPQKTVRLTAQRVLSRRGPTAIPWLAGVLTNAALPPAARWHALWALDAIDTGQVLRPAILDLAKSLPSEVPASLIRQAMRQLGERKVSDAVPILLWQLHNPEASLRFHAATALGRIGDSAATSGLIGALDESDSFAHFAVFTALNRLGREHPDVWPRVVRALDNSNLTVREGAGFAARQTYDLTLVQTLAEAAADFNRSVSAREAALRILASAHHQPAPWKGEWWAYHPALTKPPPPTLVWPGTPIILATLRERLADANPSVRLAAVEGLREAGDNDSAARLRERFGREADVKVRAALVSTLGEFGDVAALPLVIAVLDNPATEPAVLEVALVAGGKLAGRVENTSSLAASITNRLANPELPRSIRLSALDALSLCKHPGSAVWLEQFARSGDDAVRAAAFAGLARLGGPRALESLLRLAKVESPAVQRGAVTALGRLKRREAVPTLLEAWQRAETRDAALDALTELPDLRALEAYLDGMGDSSAARRAKCRHALESVAKAALPLLQERRDRLSPQVLGELRQVYARDSQALGTALFASAPKTPEPLEYARFALDHEGDPWRGQQHFFDLQTVACVKCHAVAGPGGTLGPDLTTIGAQYGRAALIESVLNPSKSVREGYQQYVVETLDDESFTGVVRAESAATLTLMDTEGRVHALPKARIKERRSSVLSLMPEGLQAALTLEQFADVIAYLESLRSDPRRSEATQAPPGFAPLFNGANLVGWKASPHWAARDGVLEHDGVADDLWSVVELGDFELRLEWRWPDEPRFEAHPVINSDGYQVKDTRGEFVRQRVLEAGDSGVFVRGFRKAQVNLFCYPVGSGEFWEYRESSSGEKRRALTPRRRADRPVGQWNDLRITLRGDRITVVLNGAEVIANASLPDLPKRGPIGFQHEHGRLQLRRIFVRELDSRTE